MNEKNSLWSFLSSVKLSLFTFFILATASIIGTIIPQGKPAEFYVNQYGRGTAELFRMLDVPDMYNSWWFLLLLVLLSFNLVVCTIDRLPNVWRLVVMNNLDTDPKRLDTMPQRKVLHFGQSPEESRQMVRSLLQKSGWRPSEAAKDGGILFFSQKGAWTRLGVYAVHLSVLVIFAGAIIGSIYGFKGSIMLPEGSTTNTIYLFDEHNTSHNLGFQVRADRFEIHFYDSGMPKEYLSDLTVLENGREVLQKRIEVNDPLDYEGITFYQSSYQPIQGELFAFISKEGGTAAQGFRAPMRQEVQWPEQGIRFGVLNVQGPDMSGQYRFKVWFADDKGAPAEFWLNLEGTARIERPDGTYDFQLKQRYATGLQVAKDPGVWWVYIGCTVMLLGLWVAFFMSHRRLWVYLAPEEGKTKVVLGGTSNKNKAGFERDFTAVLEQFEKNASTSS